jgi:V/A-type H+-transporting ATPase subunit E
LEDARQSASQTLKEADERAQKLREDNELRAEESRNAAMEQARKDCAELRDRMLRMAELDQRKELLAMKRTVIEAAFDYALSGMRAMSAEKARAFMEKTLVSLAEGDEGVIVSKGDENVFDESFVARVNELLKKAGKSANLALTGETREVGGGLMLRRGGMEVNLTYPSVLSELKPELEAEVAAILFE